MIEPILIPILLILSILIVLKVFGVSLFDQGRKNSTRVSPDSIALVSSKQRRVSAFSYKILGYCLMSGSAILFFVIVGNLTREGNTQGSFEIVVAIITFILSGAIHKLGYRCLRRGRQLVAISAEEVLQKDSRPYVLYLRSFSDDVVTNEADTIVGMQGTSGPTVTATEEEQLVQAFNLLGPVIALGLPGEDLPPTGAARKYVASNEDWKDIVSQYISQARLIVIRAGNGPGFWWELETVINLVSPNRLLILVPFSKEQYQAFRERAETFLPRKLPEYDGKQSYGTLKGCICFRNDWMGSFLRLKFPPEARATNTPLVPMLNCTLRPFLQQIGIPQESTGKYTDEDDEWEDKYRSLRCFIPFLPRSANKAKALLKFLILCSIIAAQVAWMVNQPSFLGGVGLALSLLVFLGLAWQLSDDDK
jgi:hypothetical protein